MFVFDLSLKLLMYHLIQLGIAFILSLPIALNREMKDKSAGLSVNTPFLTQHHCRIIKPPVCTQQVSYH